MTDQHAAPPHDQWPTDANPGREALRAYTRAKSVVISLV